eukprot:6485759-Amphidinium_carterae.3
MACIRKIYTSTHCVVRIKMFWGGWSVLVEFKGDWELYANALHLPHWRNNAGICYMCKATLADLADNSMTAPWRSEESRLSTTDLLARLVEQGKLVSPIWSYPFFSLGCLKPDWLHVVDLGVAAHFFGGVLCMVVDPPGLPGFGLTLEMRRCTIWNLIEAFYKQPVQRQSQTDKLKNLPLSRFRRRPPCLHAPAATVR